MSALPARGFTLALRPFAESDRIAQLYTLQWGLVRALVKGARKPKSKLSPALELFTESDLYLSKRPSGDLYLLTQAKVIDGHPTLKKDLGTITHLQVLSDLLIQALPGTEPHPEVYRMVRDFLLALEGHPGSGEALLVSFSLKFLGALGHPLELSVCAACGGPLPKRDLVLVPHQGGILCPDCGPSGSGPLALDPAGAALLEKSRALPLSKVHVLRTTAAQGRALFRTVMDYVERTLERELKTVPYYLQLRPLDR